LRPDLVVDALPGFEPSRELVEHFLAMGAEVVSANKALVAEYGPLLSALADRSDTLLSHSAAVGGSTPMIEAVTAAVARTPLQSIAGVVNGTCNFVIDRCAGGATLDHALAEARQRGFAEEDASEDLSGRDAERKLRILARRAFSQELTDVDVEALSEAAMEQVRDATADGVRLRQVARAWREGNHFRGTVKLERVPANSVLGSLSGEWNGLEITHTDDQVITVIGRGAGRWPTTEAVMADLFDALRRKMTEASCVRGA
jgi:homoserine dehydrogenase